MGFAVGKIDVPPSQARYLFPRTEAQSEAGADKPLQGWVAPGIHFHEACEIATMVPVRRLRKRPVLVPWDCRQHVLAGAPAESRFQFFDGSVYPRRRDAVFLFHDEAEVFKVAPVERVDVLRRQHVRHAAQD